MTFTSEQLEHIANEIKDRTSSEWVTLRYSEYEPSGLEGDMLQFYAGRMSYILSYHIQTKNQERPFITRKAAWIADLIERDLETQGETYLVDLCSKHILNSVKDLGER